MICYRQRSQIRTNKRYNHATIFVDQASSLGYVHLQKTSSAEDTLEAKQAFELYCLGKGVTVKGYQADNGIFRANKWQQACLKARQRLIFTGVGAHHSNGMAEKRIRDLQELTRAQLLYAASKWRGCITANLWPYALRMANEALNNSPNPKDIHRRSAEGIFSKTNTLPNSKHFKPFGCPVYVLDSALQLQNPYHKWKERGRVGIYLGRSPIHNRNVSLVLDINTGLVSPQFHVTHDINFDIVKQQTFKSHWQLKAGFKLNKGHKQIENEPIKLLKNSSQLTIEDSKDQMITKPVFCYSKMLLHL